MSIRQVIMCALRGLVWRKCQFVTDIPNTTKFLERHPGFVEAHRDFFAQHPQLLAHHPGFSTSGAGQAPIRVPPSVAGPPSMAPRPGAGKFTEGRGFSGEHGRAEAAPSMVGPPSMAPHSGVGGFTERRGFGGEHFGGGYFDGGRR